MCVCESGNSTGDYELVCAQRALCSQGPQDIHGTGVGHTPVSSAPRENQNPSRTTPIRADQGTSCARRASVLPPQAILDCPHPGCRGASRIRKLLDRSWKQHSQRQKHWGHVRGDDAPHRFRAPLFPFYLQSQTFELGLWSSTTQTPSALLHPPPPAHPFCLTLVPQRKAAMPWAHQDPVPLCRRRNTELRPGHQHGGRVPRPPWDSPEAEGQLVEGSSSTLCPSRHRRTGTGIAGGRSQLALLASTSQESPSYQGKSSQIHSRAGNTEETQHLRALLAHRDHLQGAGGSTSAVLRRAHSRPELCVLSGVQGGNADSSKQQAECKRAFPTPDTARSLCFSAQD